MAACVCLLAPRAQGAPDIHQIAGHRPSMSGPTTLAEGLSLAVGPGLSLALSLDVTLGLAGQNRCAGFRGPFTIELATLSDVSQM